MLNSEKVIKCEVFSRVVGYHRPTNNWNDGKKAEYDMRKAFNEKESFNSRFGTEQFLTNKIPSVVQSPIQNIVDSDKIGVVLLN